MGTGDGLPSWDRTRGAGKLGCPLQYVDSSAVCLPCAFAYYKGGLCANHCRHFLPKKGWCYAMALQRLRDRVDNLNGRGDAAIDSADEAFKKEMPTLWEFLTTDKWEDGSSRETGTVFVFREAGQWRACLNDRDSNHVGFVSGDTFKSLWKAVEKQLAEQRVDWRQSRQGRQGGAKRR